MPHEVSCTVDGPFAIDEHAFLRAAESVLAGELDTPAEMSIVVVDDATIQQLNRDWRGYDERTDVLSFGLSDRSKPAVDDEEPFPFPPDPDDLLHLGEVVISYPTAERQAGEHSRALDEELRHLLIHGILHLLGYDHAEPQEEGAMRAREAHFLAMFRP